MIGKLKKKISVSDKIGNNDEFPEGQMLTYISAPTLAGESGREITDILSIGREVGDLILDSDEVSARHCTFTLSHQVLSIMDHASQSGTYINKKKIPPGRVFILNEKDTIKLGNLALVIEKLSAPSELVNNSEFEESPEGVDASEEEGTSEFNLTPGTLSEAYEEVDNVDELLDHVEEDESFDDLEEVDDIAAKKKFSFSFKRKKKIKNADQKFNGLNKSVKSVSSTLTRMIALLNDVLISGIIYEIFNVYTDFNNLLEFLPKKIITALVPLIEENSKLITQVDSDLPQFLLSVLESKKIVFFLSAFILVQSLRLIATLIFGVTLGQLVLGISSRGNLFVKRGLGLLRELIGLVTFPFIIFDIPSIFSRKTFKELMSGSAIETKSSFFAIVSTILVTPLLGLSLLYSPLYKGLEYLEPVSVSLDLSDIKPIKKVKFGSFSDRMNLGAAHHPDLLTIATINFQLKKRKRVARAGLLVLDREKKSLVQIQLLKKFSLQKILKEYVRKNPLSYFTHPQILGSINNTGKNAQKKFSSKGSIGLQKKAIEQISKTLVAAYELNFYNLLDHSVNNGPILRGHRYLREVFKTIYDNPVLKMEIIKVADKVGVLTTHTRGKTPYYAFIPLGYQDAYVYTFSRKPTGKRYKTILKNITFSKGEIDKKDISAAFIDRLGKPLNKRELNQKLYESYFNFSKALMMIENKKQIERLKLSISRFLTFLKEESVSDAKLYQNFSEILNALKENDYSYFNIKKVRTV